MVKGAELLKKPSMKDSDVAKKIKTGDILQVLTSEGVAYAQVTHKNPEYGFLIRVFPGFYSKTPKDFSLAVNVEPQFSAFFIVQTAVNQGLLSVIANVPVSEKSQPFPTFRSRNGGAGGSLWLWDGQESKMLDRSLTDVEQTFPIKGIISAPLLVGRIERGYRAETHERW